MELVRVVSTEILMKHGDIMMTIRYAHPQTEQFTSKARDDISRLDQRSHGDELLSELAMYTAREGSYLPY